MKTARNIIAGALSGLGVVVLMQQYAIAYPTTIVTVLGLAAGIAAQFAVAALAPGRAAAAPSAATPNAEPLVTPQVEWKPTHLVPAGGLDTWGTPDASLPPEARLDGGLGVQIADRRGDWIHIVCENGWSAWVDGRALEVAQ